MEDFYDQYIVAWRYTQENASPHSFAMGLMLRRDKNIKQLFNGWAVTGLKNTMVRVHGIPCY